MMQIGAGLRLAGAREGVVHPGALLDESYRSFLTLLAGQIAASIANAQAYEDERKRAEALAADAPLTDAERRARDALAGKKKVVLELGGNAGAIVDASADLDWAAKRMVVGAFSYAGQVCISVQRLFVHDAVYDAFMEQFVAVASALKLGDPLDEASQMGPMNSRAQYEKVLHYIDVAKAQGARLVTGGKRPAGPEFERGYWIEPTVFADVTADMRVAQEEIFGPVVSVMKWTDEDEAIALANRTRYGLSASIFTRDLRTAMTYMHGIEAGLVRVNGEKRTGIRSTHPLVVEYCRASHPELLPCLAPIVPPRGFRLMSSL